MANLLLSNVISFLLLTYLGNNLLKPKVMSKYKSILIYFIFVISLTLLNGKSVNLYNTLNLSVGYFLYLLCKYQSKFLKKIIVLFSFMLFSAIGEVLSASISNLLSGLDSTNNIASFQYTSAILLSELIIYLFLFLYTKLVKFSYWGELPKYTYLITILPITTILFLVNIQDYFYLLRNNELLVLILIGLLTSNFVIAFIFLKTVSTLKIKSDLDVIKNEKKSIDFKYELLNTQYKANYSFMHDTIRAIMKMQISLNKEEYDSFKNELVALNKKMLRGLNIVNSNSSIISPIINFRLKEMLRNDIDFKSVIEYTDFTFLDIYDQRYIFDSLLEIGMMQCLASNSKIKFIILKTRKLYTQIIIQLITTHGEAVNSDKLTQCYNKLSEIVHSRDGGITLENGSNNESDSLIIVFNERTSQFHF